MYVKNKKGDCRVFHAPFDVKLSDDPLTIVQPDIMIVCNRDMLDGKRCNGAPDFIIEIASASNLADDYIRKLYYYQKFGVREYWIVDPYQKNVTVYWFEDESQNCQYAFDEEIAFHMYPELTICMNDLLGGNA